ncbi:hypothetical protein [Bartonella tamiae]|uniref:Uncharacterized protein n=1 Tax=Bartonella tamiae Th239 TaxID=1094558 RepID=J0ZR37_9HYPH|nr:hypothetical protein [Bartonella tamiae]EJF91148.1 hypothetical protein ME5_00480 [Bartonella tamiae Th239]EJF93187.1 hypothetical protein MEG_01401 [Bartonella tamiae Th307]
MAHTTKQKLYTYPMRGLSIIAIFLIVAPPIQTIIATYLTHQWVGGSNALIEFFDVYSNVAWPRILPGYSYYMPSVFLSGIVCSLGPSRGSGLTLTSAIIRTILVSFCVEFFYIWLSQPYMKTINAHNYLESLSFYLVQWIFAAFICWFVAKKFGLNQKIKVS